MLRRLWPVGILVVLAGAGLWEARRRAAHILDRVEEITGIATASAGTPLPVTSAIALQGTLDVRARPPGPHPRILLTPARLARVAALRDSGAPSWTLLLEQCRTAREHTIESGYEAWDWAQATLALALCAKVTGDPAYATAGLRYFKALLDDKATVGDGAGGNTGVRHDEGYSIRTRGALGAIAYDWLHDAPGMTPDLRKRAMDRFLAWTSWFKEKGFEHDQPISNYYMAYFGTVGFGGIAFEGDDPRAATLRQRTQEMWNGEVVPTYGTKLRGGDYTEGWQYGDLVGTTLAIFADAETASHPAPPSGPPRKSLFEDLPWMREAVSLRAASLHPDGKHTYDNGDWSHMPAVAPVHLLEALSTVLPSTDIAGRQATFLARLARLQNKDEKEEFTWLRVLADDPARAAEDPRKAQMSYLAPGTGTVFARSSSGVGALWASLTFEPTLSPHEHRDAGHFEIVRGSDRLFIDGGSYESFSSFSHNVVLIDDPLQSSDYDTSIAHKDIITYKSVQGGWSYTSHVARFEEGGGYAYALGSYDSAFNPIGFPDERKDRAVTRAEREWVFSRKPVSGVGAGESGRFVIYDRFTFSDPRFTATFILHGGLAPQINGPVARFTTGASSGWVTTLVPKGAVASVADETNNKPSPDRVYFTNMPPEGVTSFRYQVASPANPPAPANPAAALERRFLHTIVAGAAGAPLVPAAAAIAIEGPGVAGAAIDGEAYVFSSAGPAEQAVTLSYRAPASATRHLVFDLAPSAHYGVSAAAEGDGCRVTLTPSAGASRGASANGALALDVVGCAVR